MLASAFSPISASPPRWVVAALVGAALLAGCGDKKDGQPTQAAAKVNKEELTVHQINAVLARQRALSPDQAEAASRRVLEGLIDQELAVQKAAEMRLDRDPRVVQAIEAMRREIIARAYVEKIGEAAGRPSAAEVKKYYDDNPALFRERRIFQIQEFNVQATADQVAALRDRLQAAKSPLDLAQVLRADNLKFSTAQTVRAAEQVPLDRLPQLAALKDGQALVTPVPGGASVVQMMASRAQPIDEGKAAPAIEQFLLNDRKRRLVSQDLKALRNAAKIEYVGTYAGSSPPAEAVSAPSVADAAASAAAALEQQLAAEPVPSAASATANARSAAAEADSAAIRKGLGFK
jgi:EpsD family peptidyl-prolyl cis-trans isomerase